MVLEKKKNILIIIIITDIIITSINKLINIETKLTEFSVSVVREKSVGFTINESRDQFPEAAGHLGPSVA